MLRFYKFFSPLPKCSMYDDPRQEQNFLISVNIVSLYPFLRISVKQMLHTRVFCHKYCRNNAYCLYEMNGLNAISYKQSKEALLTVYDFIISFYSCFRIRNVQINSFNIDFFTYITVLCKRFRATRFLAFT